jgi:hypothetical protein
MFGILPFLYGPLPAAAQHQLSEAEAQIVLDCRSNVMGARPALSPDTAQTCVDKFLASDGDLMEKAKNDFPEITVDVLSRSNALTDLRNMISKYDGMNLAKALMRVTENTDCVPCKMSLGPEPEKIAPWVKKSVAERDIDFQLAVRSWDTLGEIRTKAMSAPGYGYTEESWGRLKLMERYDKLYDWAKTATDSLVASASMAGRGKAAAPDYKGLADELKYELYNFNDYARVKKLNDMLGGLSAKAAAPAAGPSAADKAGGKLTEDAAKLNAARAGSGEGAFLNHAFDNAKDGAGGADASGGSGKKDFKPVPITEEQAKELTGKMATVKDGKMQGYMADEIKGTKAGDEIADFYEGSKYAGTKAAAMNFVFEEGKGDLADAMGWYSSKDKVLRVNTSLVDKFARDRGITPAQLLKDPEKMRELAAYVAPTFVHEATHQRQDAWSEANGLNYYTDSKGKKFAPYQMEMETEAFSMNAAFVAEKAKTGGLAYLRKLDGADRDDAEKYLQDGVDGLRTERHTYDYYAKYTDTIPGAASKELQGARNSAEWVRYLTIKAKEDPGGVTAEDRANLYRAQQALDTRFKWYKGVLFKSKDDEAKLLAWRNEVDPDGSVLKTVKSYSVAPLPGGE